MRFKIRNVKDQKSYNVEVKDENVTKRVRRATLDENSDSSTREERLKKWRDLKKVEAKDESAEEEKESSEKESSEKESSEKEEEIKLSKKQVEQLEELIKLLPDLKKILEKDSESSEEHSVKEDDVEESVTEILMEESEDNPAPEDEIEEEEVIEDEGGCGTCDSINPGVVEKVSNGNKDTISHEIEVAETWGSRYNQLLNHK